MECSKFKFALGNFSIELESPDKEWIESKLAEFKGVIDKYKSFAEARDHIDIGNESPQSARPTSTLPSGLSANEFYRQYAEKVVKSRTEMGVFFVYYLTQTTGKKEFTSAEVKEVFREVGYPNWNRINIPDALYQAKKRALLNNVGSLWSLSMTGVDFVLSKLSNEE